MASLAQGSRKKKGRFADAWMVPEGLARVLFRFERKKFLRRLQVMARARLPLAESIAELKQRAYQSKKGVMYAALSSMEHRLRRGRGIAEVLQGWLPETQIMLLQAGEQSGYENFAQAIEDVIALQGATGEMITAIVGGLVEPTLLVLANYALVLWLTANFTHQVFDLLSVKPEQFTGQAYQFYLVGQFAQSFWAWLIPLILIGLMVWLFLSLPRATGRWRVPLDRYVPPWSVYRAITGAGWMISFSKLAQARYSYEDILRRTAALSQPWLRTRILAIDRGVRAGLPLGEAMRRAGYGFPSIDLIDDVATFNNRPGFEETLDVLAKEWVKLTTAQVKGLAFALTGIAWIMTSAAMIWVFTAFNAVQSQLTALMQMAAR